MIQKPFIKWVGGKQKLLDNFITYIPKEMNNYHELFLGGGSFLFMILSLVNDNKISIKGNIYAYDINKNLINMYINIQKNSRELYNYLIKYFKEYDSIKSNIIIKNPTKLEEALSSKENYYYYIRNIYNNNNNINDIEKSAIFIFLNKTCFRGLYREGPNGFNVPYGHYKKTPNIFSINELNNITTLIKNVNFICTDFIESNNNIKNNDFIYMDPPYYPVNEKSFTDYNYIKFDKNKQIELFNFIIKLKDIKFILSNSNTETVLTFFKNYNIKKIKVRRYINSKNPGTEETEIFIYN